MCARGRDAAESARAAREVGNGVPSGEDMGATDGRMLAVVLRSADSRVGMKFAETTRSACNAASMREMSDSGT